VKKHGGEGVNHGGGPLSGTKLFAGGSSLHKNKRTPLCLSFPFCHTVFLGRGFYLPPEGKKKKKKRGSPPAFCVFLSPRRFFAPGGRAFFFFKKTGVLGRETSFLSKRDWAHIKPQKLPGPLYIFPGGGKKTRKRLGGVFFRLLFPLLPFDLEFFIVWDLPVFFSNPRFFVFF